jgi:hypothetical protein
MHYDFIHRQIANKLHVQEPIHAQCATKRADCGILAALRNPLCASGVPAVVAAFAAAAAQPSPAR